MKRKSVHSLINFNCSNSWEGCDLSLVKYLLLEKRIYISLHHVSPNSPLGHQPHQTTSN
jgi:hypothetical protein